MPPTPSHASPVNSDLRGGRVLVLGASGYIGSHLVPDLVARGVTVRAAARRVTALQARAWPGVEIVGADALDEASLDRALAGIDVAYYLVHSMAAGADFPQRDRQAAAHFAAAAARAGVRRIIYLGGLQPPGQASTHLASRGETGDVLRRGSVPVTELRAGVIIGPGSAAFEVIRDLVYHLPVMVTPRWVDSRSQPIALADVLEYLARLPFQAEAAGAVYDAGGPEVLTYRDLMRQFGELVGRRPLILPVPVLTPRLSSYWLDLVTAVPANVARALIDGLEHDVLADDAALRTLIPLTLRTYREAARAALDAERDERADHAGRRWTEGSMRYRRERADFAFYAKHMEAEAACAAPADALWRTVASIGGEQGYYFLNGLWEARGCLDRLAGGVGMRKGQRRDGNPAVGDEIDFWRVAEVDPGHRLTLIAEMKLPGAAALEFEVRPLGERRSQLGVRSYFRHGARHGGTRRGRRGAGFRRALTTGRTTAARCRTAPGSRRPRPAARSACR
ncbi:MAG: SDR family oxidoreductase [Ideonella sp.]|nr:SDR family oxidoreductase [Ideonella sp.]